MIGVVVTFRLGNEFDEQGVQKIAETARAIFEGMPGQFVQIATLVENTRR
jgi:hypothetical protein